MTHDGFLARLLEMQGSDSDAAMARHLNISRSYWHCIKHGKRPISVAFARRVARQHPELAGWYLAQVAQSVTAA